MSLTLTPGLLVDAELAYRRERLASDLAGSRSVVAWLRGLRRRSTRATDRLVLAA